LVPFDRGGKESTTSTDEVQEYRLTRLSAMPADFGAVIAERALYDLVAFLLARVR
jgi:hypothetical protein